MRSLRLSALGFAVAAVVLGGYTSVSAQEEPKKRTRKNCIKTSEINAITPLDDRHLFIKISATRYHLFTVDETCRGLKYARRVAIADEVRRVCDDGMALITFTEPTVGTMRCRINRVDDVESKAAAWELIESREGPQ